MKKLVLLLFLCPLFGISQDMNNEKLQEIYTAVSDSINGRLGGWQFFVNNTPIISITDENHNRMRIISPIREANNLNEELVRAALVANFHTALDVKYAVSEGILWSVFIHPLKELTQHQVEDAVSQVYEANKNFGTTFASTSLSFPGTIRGGETEEAPEEEKKEIEFKKS